MKRMKVVTIGSVMLAAAAAVACAQDSESQNPAVTTDTIVARIGDEVITETELEAMVGPSLVKFRQDIYETTVAQLQAQIFDRLVVAKATEAGKTRADYLKEQVDDKVTDPDEGEIVKVMSMYRNRLAADDAEARQQIIQGLRQQAGIALADQLRLELFAEAGVEILLEPPRVDVAISETTPSRGPANAPIVLVEYTDYQCPYCSRVQPTITALMERYEGQVLHVFKNLPLPNHQQAQLASEAALCAQDQGQFWEFHDWLFENQRTMNKDSMVAESGELGMDAELFAACVDQHTYTETVDADMREARGFGITGTPGFMINGRVVSGAQPIENFEKIIDEELTLKGIEIPPKKAPEAAADAQETATE